MSGIKKVLTMSVLILLIMAVLIGCPMLLKDSTIKSGQYIELNIGSDSAAKAIKVTEYDVTKLEIEIYDPQGVLIDDFSWYPDEGQQSYLIPVTVEGEHEIVVTHISDENGTVIEAVESAFFNIEAMIITAINIIPGFIGYIDITPGSEGISEEDGTLTVSLTGISAPDGTFTPMGLFPEGADMSGDPMLLIVAMGGDPGLIGGAVSSTMCVPNTQIPWIGTGGTTYDLYIWVDMNGNLEFGAYMPEPGIDLQLTDFPVTVEINGDTSMEFTGSNFILVP